MFAHYKARARLLSMCLDGLRHEAGAAAVSTAWSGPSDHRAERVSTECCCSLACGASLLTHRYKASAHVRCTARCLTRSTCAVSKWHSMLTNSAGAINLTRVTRGRRVRRLSGEMQLVLRAEDIILLLLLLGHGRALVGDYGLIQERCCALLVRARLIDLSFGSSRLCRAQALEGQCCRRSTVFAHIPIIFHIIWCDTDLY